MKIVHWVKREQSGLFRTTDLCDSWKVVGSGMVARFDAHYETILEGRGHRSRRKTKG